MPTARISGSYTGITGVGTLTAGVWNATDIALADGGTNASLTASAGAVAYSTASAIAFTGVGTAGQVLTSAGTSVPTWTTILPSGTAMLFAQAAAPTGWTKSTTHDNKALRVVTGSSGGSAGGTVNFTTAFASKAVSGTVGSTTATGTVGSTVLDATQIPSHTHFVSSADSVGTTPTLSATNALAKQRSDTNNSPNYNLTGSPTDLATIGLTSATGGGLGHTHTFTGTSHDHPFTGTAIDMAVQYVDVIIATKD